jgi:hypothetical protein
MIIEFIKKHQRLLGSGFCVSALLLALIMVSFALHPVEFLFEVSTFLFLGYLLIAGLMLAFEKIKIGTESLVHGDFERIETKEDNVQEEINKTTDIMLVEGTINDAVVVSPEADLAAFQKEANYLWSAQNISITTSHDLSQLLTQCKQFGQTYYTLARKYHPDKGAESEKVVRTAYIQELNNIYKPVKERLDQKLENLKENLKPSESKEGLIEQERILLIQLLALLEEHRKWRDEFREQINALKLQFINKTDEEIVLVKTQKKILSNLIQVMHEKGHLTTEEVNQLEEPINKRYFVCPSI